MNEEVKKVLELLRQLKFEQTKEFFYMVKGAAFVAKDQKGAQS